MSFATKYNGFYCKKGYFSAELGNQVIYRLSYSNSLVLSLMDELTTHFLPIILGIRKANSYQ